MEIGQTDAKGRQQPVFLRAQQAWRQPDFIQQGVKAVAGIRVVVARLPRTDAGIRAKHHDAQAGNENIGQAPANRGVQSRASYRALYHAVPPKKALTPHASVVP